VIEMNRSALQERVQSVGEANDVLVLDGAVRAEEMEGLAIEAADLVLIPVQPSAHDIWLTEPLVERIQARSPRPRRTNFRAGALRGGN